MTYHHERKIFILPAGGGQDTDRHYHDTIETKRTVEEAARFLGTHEAEQLKIVFHGQPFAVWGAVPGSANRKRWDSMEPGDYVLVARNGKIILAAEVAMKVHSERLAEYYWRRDANNQTWELVYFLINDVAVDVSQKELNAYLQYKENFTVQGFSRIDQEKVNTLLTVYGDPLSLLQRIERGEKPEEIDLGKQKEFDQVVDERVEKAPTEHVEMQWRLIRLGNRAHFDVWVPRNDQHHVYQGEKFADITLKDFHEAMDIPVYIQNIDTVWKSGLSVRSAFEIENSTSIYSGILRLSDLRTLAPNSNYPLFIVAQQEKKSRVFEQLSRPTFANPYLGLDKVVKFLSYDTVRQLDEDFKGDKVGFDIGWLTEKAEGV